MSELKAYTYDDMIDGDADTNIEYYPKSDADAIIAQKDFEIDRLKEFNAFLKQRISNGDVGCSIFLYELEQKDKEIAELKAKLENVQASMYCDVVDANMENRRLKEERRWRKFPEEKPKWGEEVLVVDDESKQYIVRFSHDMKWISWGNMNTCESNCVEYWMQLPKAPKDAK